MCINTNKFRGAKKVYRRSFSLHAWLGERMNARMPGNNPKMDPFSLYGMMKKIRTKESRVTRKQNQIKNNNSSIAFFTGCSADDMDPPLCTVEIFLMISLR